MSALAGYQHTKSAAVGAVAVLAGSVVAVVTDLAAVVAIDGIGFVSDTISNAAAGRRAWIQDAGLCVFGVGLGGLAYGLWRSSVQDWKTLCSAISVAVVGLAVIVLALHDKYGDGDTRGAVFHRELVHI